MNMQDHIDLEVNNMNLPMISVIVPAYNAGKYIDKCIRSILSSSLSSFELIVVDDSSEDNTLEQLNNIDDLRLRIVAKNTRGGVSQARNTGIEKASGDYITFVDADDWIAPTMLEQLLKSAQSNDSDVTLCNHFIVFQDREENACDLGSDIVYKGYQCNQYIQMFMLKGKKDFEPYFPIGQPWGTLYKANVIKDNGIRFIEGMQYKEDVIFNLYVAQHSKTIKRIREPLYYYNKCNPNSLTTSELKKGMIPRIEMDISERIKFYNSFRTDDELFKLGLFQYIFRSFYRNIVPACIIDANYSRCKEIRKNAIYDAAITHVDKKYLTNVEKVIAIILQNNGLFLYYFATKLLVKLKGKGRIFV